MAADHPELGNTMLALGQTYLYMERYTDAVSMNRQTLEFWSGARF
jgi:hypothetical protein